MLFNVTVNDEKQGMDFLNNILNDLEKEEAESLEYSDATLKVSPRQKSQHISEGPFDITIENHLVLAITVADLDFSTQETIKKHRRMLNRL